VTNFATETKPRDRPRRVAVTILSKQTGNFSSWTDNLEEEDVWPTY
jgi:hypothetical protein